MQLDLMTGSRAGFRQPQAIALQAAEREIAAQHEGQSPDRGRHAGAASRRRARDQTISGGSEMKHGGSMLPVANAEPTPRAAATGWPR